MTQLVNQLDILLPGDRPFVAPSAFLQARQKLGDKSIERLFHETASRWHHRPIIPVGPGCNCSPLMAGCGAHPIPRTMPPPLPSPAPSMARPPIRRCTCFARWWANNPKLTDMSLKDAGRRHCWAEMLDMDVKSGQYEYRLLRHWFAEEK